MERESKREYVCICNRNLFILEFIELCLLNTNKSKGLHKHKPTSLAFIL